MAEHSNGRAGRWAGLFIAVSLASGCEALTPAADTPAPAAPPVVRPGSRIAWDQPVLDGTDVAAYRFVLVVDDARVPLEIVRCEAGRPLWPAACSAPLPPLDRGRHGLAVIALGLGARGRESRPSPTIEIDVP